MTALIVFQFYQPQSAWINRAPGGMEGGGFSGALGRFRPPGTFSFIVGIVWFYTFATAFLIAGLTQHHKYSKFLLILSAMAICLSIPISISRSLILSVGLTVFIGLGILALQRNMMMRFLRIASVLCIGLVIVSSLPFFEEARDAFGQRWKESTRESQGGVQTMIVWRIANEFLGPFMQLEKMPVIGAGIGAGTMVGAQYLTGRRKFYLGEGDWFRIMEESGLIVGTAFILWRLALTIKLAKLSLKALRFTGNGLAILIFSATAFNLLVGQLGQATINGFTILGVGLTIAAMRTSKKKETPKDTASIKSDAAEAEPSTG